MPARLTLLDAKNSGLPETLGLCSTSPVFLRWLNEAVLRLVNRGKWPGTYQRYHICVTDGCLTWPRQIESIEAVWLCNQPLAVRGEWFEAVDSGPWLQSDGGDTGTGGCATNYLQLYDRGQAVTFADIIPPTKTLRVYADNANDVGKTILLQGYDDNGNWILTNNGATQGEEVTLALPFVDTVNFFSALTGVQKPVTLGNVRLYEYDTVATTQRQLGIYEPSETRPIYRRSFIPGVAQLGACCGPQSEPEECSSKSVTVMANLRVLPLVSDTDWLLVGNIAALKEMCLAVKYGETESDNGQRLAAVHEARAVVEMERELGRYQGDGMTQSLKVINATQWGAAQNFQVQ